MKFLLDIIQNRISKSKHTTKRLLTGFGKEYNLNSLKQKYTAYVIDADTSARRGISRLLFTAGYKIKAHSSLKEFVKILSPYITGFIIIDVANSCVTMVELLSALKEHSLSMPIIVVSDEADASARNKARELKAVGFFRKPVDGKALLDTIKWVTKENMQGQS